MRITLLNFYGVGQSSFRIAARYSTLAFLIDARPHASRPYFVSAGPIKRIVQCQVDHTFFVYKVQHEDG